MEGGRGIKPPKPKNLTPLMVTADTVSAVAIYLVQSPDFGSEQQLFPSYDFTSQRSDTAMFHSNSHPMRR
jgi:hypothetical protein